MKILMPNHFPIQGSGSGIYTMNVASELQKMGHEVMAIVPGHKPEDEYPFKTKTIIFNNGENENPQLDFNFPCFTAHPRSNTTFYELTDEQMQAYIQSWQNAINEAVVDFKPDVVHAHHVWVTSFAAYTAGLPYVITCHGTDLFGFRKGPRYQSLALTAAKNAYRIIAISRQVQSETIETYNLPAERVKLVWNGFGTDHFRVIPDATKEAVLAEYGLTGSDKPLVSFVGKYTRFKGIDVLLKAAVIYEKHLPGIQTLLAGNGELWDEMHTLREELGLSGIHFLGHQTQDKVARLYNAADVSVVSSRGEPFGLVAVEALACGTPVVATNEGGLPDFMNEEVGTLVPVEDPESLAQGVIGEIEQNTKHTKGVYANKYAYENFTWESQVALMADLYREAIEQ